MNCLLFPSGDFRLIPAWPQAADLRHASIATASTEEYARNMLHQMLGEKNAAAARRRRDKAFSRRSG
ncbi:MAG: hypothetical protein HZB29_07185 [Nitrospinae bacterium]|nr:hypothetical protein [Nitrospinota bacterium]